MSGEYRQAKIYVQDRLAGVLKETEEGYSFLYNEKYLKEKDAVAISLTMPLKKEEYVSNVLLAACRDCIGDVSIRSVS